MAKKARKKSKAKARTAKRAKTRTRVTAKARPKRAAARTPARKSRAKAQTKGIAGKVASAFHTVVDTIKETQELRNKLEPPGVSESE